jgi:hypothetical protein
LSPNIDSAFPATAFLPRDTTNPALVAGFFVLVRQGIWRTASFPLRFCHGPPDNAVRSLTNVEDQRKPRNLFERYLNVL